MKKLPTVLVLLLCTLASPVVPASIRPEASRAVHVGGKRRHIAPDDAPGSAPRPAEEAQQEAPS